MRNSLLAALAIAFLTGAAQAAELEGCAMTGPMRTTSLEDARANSDCEKKVDGQDTINDCALYRFVLSQATLTEAYNRAFPAVAKFKPAVRDHAKTDLEASFAKSQAAWCAYREASCTFDADSLEGGSMQPMIAFSCRREKNEARIKALDTLATCYQGGDCQWPPLLYMYELSPNAPP
jgi:uncharacterized protein YecT (DUF1311 family)